ncbi:Indoleamine 2,3-dioxygenase [Madurella mycetomatis]|uniref:Indoleamine 2,3-dioxygenase n=1 Tax=Madurella mycetomatis TaxID=100816 RepID=A0A175WJE6_9PEZI|nr:Indoleamine 2,3-dioxygenase [Madurella mycetomatis]
MSPCEMLLQPKCGGTADFLNVLLQEYAVTSNGFLPEAVPLDRLADPYYSPWESLIDSLSVFLEDRTLRSRVDQLPVLSTEHLATEAEWRRACVILGFLTHAYIWGGDKAAEILPPSITIPLLSVSGHLGIPPVATYASVNLWNFRTTNPSLDLTDLDSVHALHTFTGTEDESWFYMVSVAMEAQGAYIIPVMLQALDAVKRRDCAAITRSLTEMTACIHKLGLLLDRMDEKCNPSVFYHRIRPFLAGSKNMASAGLPSGVFYDEGHGKGQWRQLRGGSNGQSSLIQFFDLALGVEHTAHGNSNPDKGTGRGGDVGNKVMSFHQEVRAYMPEPHRRFLQHVAESYPGGMRKGVADLVAPGAAPGEEQLALQEAFQTATKTLAGFRNKHLQIVARYIIIPSRQPNGEQGVNLATASSRVKTASEAEGRTGGELTGTGGTALLPFLKQSRDETFRAGEFR